MSTSRRDFIRVSCCSAAGMGVLAGLGRYGLLNALAQGGPAYRALVCIFLFGGNDGNNLLVPMVNTGQTGFNYNDYLAIRAAQGSGGLALTQTELLPATAATAQPSGVRDFGFHPSLPQVRGLFQNNRAAVVANMGVLFEPLTRAEYVSRSKPRPANLFSHSDQQQQWQTSVPSGFGTTGWAGRTADSVHALYNVGANFPPITTVAGAAILCTGNQTNPFAMVPGSTPGLSGFGTSAAENARLMAFQQLLTFDTGISLVQAASSITGQAVQQSAALAAALSGVQLTTVFPATSIGNQLAQVARIIKARSALDVNLRRQVFFCSMGGYDTHTTQIPDQQNLFGQLDAGMKAFYDATVELNVASDVTTFTLSEFGRTLKPAAGAGSDHGWGSHQIVMGGGVRGGDVYGQLPKFVLGGSDPQSVDASSNGRWIPTTSLDQYGATIASWFGVPAADLNTVFPNLGNFSTPDLGFML